MKCQKCNKPATVHITELVGKKCVELHFCEDHAKQYLETSEIGSSEISLPDMAAQLEEAAQMKQVTEKLAELDTKTCPVCGISFSEFRNQGRLGCPHDYIEFGEELEQLLWNIHGANEHTGKHPKVAPFDSDERTQLIKLRREMKEAVVLEEYEKASEIRDQIQNIEKSWHEQTKK